MAYTLADVHEVIDRLWPASDAESWDAPGLVTGDPGASIASILLCVDAVADTVAEAIDIGADLLLSHHPLLLRPVTTVGEDRYKGALIARLIRANCALIGAHTNADIVPDGVSDVIAARLGLHQARPIVETVDATRGLGRYGTLPKPVTLGRFARAVADLLPDTAGGVRVAGDYDSTIQTVALCGGAGDGLLNEPAVREADVYITSDLRHHPASEAREQARIGGGPALIDVSHWASEWLWLQTAADYLRRELAGVSVTVSDIRTDPWDFAIA